MQKPFIWLQHSLPQHALSRLTGWLAERRRPRWLVRGVIRLFVRVYGVDLGEADLPPDGHFATFNGFFTRPLRAGARPLAEAPVIAPVDGNVSQCGVIDGGRILQAKGRRYSVAALLGGDEDRADAYRDGTFATLYLSPRDYHRVHMPCAGRLAGTSYVPGRLFSVNGTTAAAVDRLFARNERLVCHFEGEHGPFAMVLVGAMIVAGIETVWAGRVTPPRGHRILRTGPPAQPVTLARGEEMGRFCLGSTVILLFPRGVVRWDDRCAPGAVTRLGEALAQRP